MEHAPKLGCVLMAAGNARRFGENKRGVRGNPCIFPARFFPELLELQGDHGGNTVIRRHEEELLLVEAPEAELTDVDTPEALRALMHTE